MSETHRLQVSGWSLTGDRIRLLLGCAYLLYLLSLPAVLVCGPVALMAAGVDPAPAVRGTATAVVAGYLLAVAVALR